MSEQDRKERLPGRFEAMLKNWPVAPRDDAFWDDSAEKVNERLSGAQANLALLVAPLPPEAGEPGFAARADEPPPRSLADLARSVAAEAPKDEASDLMRASLSLSQSARASAPMIADEARANAAVTAEPPGPPPAQAVASVHPLPTGPAPARSGAGPLLMAGIGLLGLAAAAVIVVRAQQSAAPVPVAASPSSAPPAAAPTVAASAPGESVVSINDLAPTAGGASPAARPSGEKLAMKGAGAEPKGAEPKAAAEAKPEPPPEPVAKVDEKKDDEAAKQMKPAATAGELPDKPSTGAVQAAIGSVMGSARACVAGHDEASRATLTFGSDGRVQSVAVSGKAAGTPAEACIKAALGKARVQPFARPSFSVGTTIRP